MPIKQIIACLARAFFKLHLTCKCSRCCECDSDCMEAPTQTPPATPPPPSPHISPHRRRKLPIKPTEKISV